MHIIYGLRRLAPLALSLLVCFAAVAAPGALAQRNRAGGRPVNSAASRRPAAFTRPRLVLLIVVDQFRYDYIERFGDLFVDRGLGRLLRDGASWADASYDHIPTETAPGHATLLTGTWPSENGIISNAWYDREAGKRVTSVSDEAARLLGGAEGEGAASPRRLLVSSLGDQLRLESVGRSKVIGISVKDRGAILPAGLRGTGAYWYSSQTGRMVSSDYYFPQLPAWVERFNAARPADKYFGARWERLLPEPEYTRRAGADAPPWEDIGAAKDTNTFPHIITGGAGAPAPAFYDALNYSPFSNDLLLAFTREAIVNEALGADADTDVLSVSFSANDIVGHRFGPYSQETMDMTLRLDRQVAELLDFVDARVGPGNTLVAFTADHGVALVPEHATALNLPGGRIKPAEVLQAMREAVRGHYAKAGDERDSTADYIRTFSDGNLYFNAEALRRDRISPEEIQRVAGEGALRVPGIRRYFTRTQLEGGAISPADPVARRALHGFNSRRSGDVIVIYDPFKYMTESNVVAMHGAPYSYDTHVPLIIMGGRVNPGRYLQAATPADLAPTLAALLRVQAPSNATGRVLTEAIKP